jgi:hypothetical protein
MTLPDWRARLAGRGVDWWVPVSCAVALLVYLARGLDGELGRDAGIYAYAGQQVADGHAPYVGILNRVGPLAHLFPGVGVVGARAVGADDLVGIRVVYVLLATACVGLVYLLCRDLFRSRLAGLASAGAFLCFQGFITLAASSPREKTAMVLFLVASLLAVVHQRWLAAGFCIALATLTWQPVFLIALAGTVTAVLVGLPSGRMRALLRVAVGGLVPTAVTLGAYAAIGELRLFLDDFLLINARYTDQQGILEQPRLAWGILVEGFGVSLGVIGVGLVVLLTLTTAALVRRQGLREPRTAALVGAGVASVVAVLWTGRAYNSWPDILFLLPLAAIGIGGLAHEVRHHLPVRVAVVITVAWTLVAATMAVSYSVTTRDHLLADQRASVEAVLEVVPRARMLSVAAPEPLVLAGKRNPSRIQLFGNGLIDYVEDTWPGGIQGYAEWVTTTSRPTIVAIGTTVPGWLRPSFRDAYVLAGPAPGWTWYVRRDAPMPVRRALRTALEDAAGAVQG